MAGFHDIVDCIGADKQDVGIHEGGKFALAGLHRGDDLVVVIGGRRPGPFAFGEQLERGAADVHVDRRPRSKGVAAGKGHLPLGPRAWTVKDHQQGLATVHRHNATIAGVYGFFRRGHAPAFGRVVFDEYAPVRLCCHAVRALRLRENAACAQTRQRRRKTNRPKVHHLPGPPAAINLNITTIPQWQPFGRRS